MSTTVIVFLAFFVLIVVYFIHVYNKLVELRNKFKNAFVQIDIQLKRRYDLIPNLVKVAKEAMEHEKETLVAVIEARNGARSSLQAAAENPGDAVLVSQLVAAETNLSGAMSGFRMVMEAYPDLKTNQNMMQLSEELTSTDNKVTFARQAFNDLVMDYNTYRQSMPQILFAPAFGHPADAKMLEFDDREAIQAAAKVEF